MDTNRKLVIESWLQLPQENIVRSFEKCCLSNAFDGTEDGAIFVEDGDYDKLDTEDIYLYVRIK